MNRPNDVDARLQQAYRAVGRLGSAGESCPSAAEMWRAAQGELSQREALRVVDHVSTCRACIGAWQLANELAPDGTGSAASSRPRARRSIPGWGMALAAAVFLGLVTLPFLLERRSPPEVSTFRSVDLLEISSAVAADTPLPRRDCVLRWTAPEGAVSYRLDVTTEELEPLITARGLDASEFRIPTEKLDVVEPGGRILWRVEATMPDGNRILSPTFGNIVTD
jgi:hypothetical protein